MDFMIVCFALPILIVLRKALDAELLKKKNNESNTVLKNQIYFYGLFALFCWSISNLIFYFSGSKAFLIFPIAIITGAILFYVVKKLAAMYFD